MCVCVCVYELFSNTQEQKPKGNYKVLGKKIRNLK